jgi:hypothetical protein
VTTRAPAPELLMRRNKPFMGPAMHSVAGVELSNSAEGLAASRSLDALIVTGARGTVYSRFSSTHSDKKLTPLSKAGHTMNV